MNWRGFILFFSFMGVLHAQSLDELIANHEFELARERIEELIETRRELSLQSSSPQNTQKLGEVLLTAGMVVDRCGQPQKAVSYLEEASDLLADDRWQGDVADALGKAFQHLGDYEKAEAYFLQAIAYRKEEPEWKRASLDHLGLLRILQGHLHEAGLIFQENLATTPAEMTSQCLLRMSNLARYYWVARRWHEAEEVLLEALQLAKSLPPVQTAPIYAELAEVYLATERASEAAHLLSEVTAQLDPGKREELLLLAELSGSAAVAFLDIGEIAESQLILEELIPFIERELSSEFLALSSLRLTLAECYLRSEQPTKAQALFPQILAQLEGSVSVDSLPNLHARRLRARAFQSAEQVPENLSTLQIHTAVTQKIAFQGSDLQRLEFFREAAYPLLTAQDSAEEIAQYALNSKGLVTEILFRERSMEPKLLNRIGQLENALAFEPGNANLQAELRRQVSQKKTLALSKPDYSQITDRLGPNDALVDFLVYLTPESAQPQIGAIIYQHQKSPLWLGELVKQRTLRSYLSVIHREFQKELEAQETKTAYQRRVKVEVLVQKLSESLWQPISRHLPVEIERLFLSPDGVVSYLPTSILLEKDGSLLVQKKTAFIYLT